MHPLVVGSRTPSEVQLLDAGPVREGDDPPAGGPQGTGVPSGNRLRLVTTFQKVQQLGDQAFELVPSEPLPAKHWFLFAEGPAIRGAFATGDRIAGAGPPDPPILELDRLEIWNPTVRTTCDTGGALALLFRADSVTEPRLLAFWLDGDEQGPPRGFVEVRNGQLKLGRWHVCDQLGMSLRPGPVRVVLREWTTTGLSGPIRLEFSVPPS